MIFSLLQVKLLTYYLTQSQYGILIQINMSIGLIVILAGLNLGHGTIRLASSEPRLNQHSYLATCIISQIFSVILVYLIYSIILREWVEFITKVETNASLLNVMFAISILMLINGQLNHFLTYTNRALMMVKIGTASTITTFLLMASAVIITHTIEGALLGTFLAQLLVFLLLMISANLKWQELNYKWAYFIAIARLGLPLVLVSLAYWSLNSSNRFIVQYYLGPQEVAKYTVATALPAMIVTVYTLVSPMFFVKISQFYDQKRTNDLSTWMSASIKYYLIISVVLSVMLITSSRQLTVMISNHDYWFSDLPFVYALSCASSVVFGIFQIYSRIFDLDKNPLRNSLNWLVAMIINALLSYILIPLLGLVGAAMALLLALVCGLWVASRYKSICMAWNIKWWHTSFFGITCIVGSLIYTQFIGNHLTIPGGLIMAVFLGFLVILAGLVAGIINRDEINLIVRK